MDHIFSKNAHTSKYMSYYTACHHLIYKHESLIHPDVHPLFYPAYISGMHARIMLVKMQQVSIRTTGVLRIGFSRVKFNLITAQVWVVLFYNQTNSSKKFVQQIAFA